MSGKHLPIIIDLEMSFKNIIAMSGNNFMLKVNLFSVIFVAFKKADWIFGGWLHLKIQIGSLME